MIGEVLNSMRKHSRQIKKMFYGSFIALLLISAFPFSTYAQMRTDSNTISTQVGHPTTSTSPSQNVSSDSVINTGEDIKAAYDHCGTNTYERSGLASCLKGVLQGLGYTADKLSAFETRRQSSLVPENNGGRCTECLGYVGVVLAIATGDTSALLGPYSAAAVADSNSYQVGTYTYRRIPASQPPSPGDFGVSTSGGSGHIVLVKEVHGATFIALESNQQETCQITDNRDTPLSNYIFYHKQ